METMYKIRKPKQISASKKVLYSVLLLLAGLAIGVVAKVSDLNSEILGNIFSEFSIWFLICTTIAIYSASPMRAGFNVLVFCVGMLITYYLTAIWLDAVWGSAFAYGWTVFALCLPVFAFFTWFALGKGKIALVLRIGILTVMVLSQLILFRLRIWDIVFVLITGILLFRRKQKI